MFKKRSLFSYLLCVIVLSCGGGGGEKNPSGVATVSSQEAALSSTMMEVLRSELPPGDGFYYAIAGPFELEPGTVITQALGDPTIRYEVQSDNKTLFFAYDSRFMFAQPGKVIYFIFENTTLIHFIKSGWWPAVLDLNGEWKEYLGGTQKEREEKEFKPPEKEIPPFFLKTDELPQDITFFSELPKNDCCEFRKFALSVSTYSDDFMVGGAKRMGNTLEKMGYKTKTDTTVRRRSELSALLQETALLFDPPQAECPCPPPCCGEFTLYLTGHGSEDGYITFEPEGFIFKKQHSSFHYSALAAEILKAFEGRCVKINVIIDSCFSGTAFPQFAGAMPQTPHCEFCLITPVDFKTYARGGGNSTTLVEAMRHCRKEFFEKNGYWPKGLDEIWQCVLDIAPKVNEKWGEDFYEATGFRRSGYKPLNPNKNCF